MPIRPEHRHHYGPLWDAISRYVRFDRESGRCQHCQRKHGQIVYELPDGRHFDGLWWRYPSGIPAPFPTLLEWVNVRAKTVWLATAHLDHDPEHISDSNLAALCQRCHLEHDRKAHLHASFETRRRHNAIRDLFRIA